MPIWTRATDKLFVSSLPRRIQSILYRIRFREEGKTFSSLYGVGSRKNVVALNIFHTYFFEHVRELWECLKSEGDMSGFVAVPTPIPVRRHKRELRETLEKKYSIRYGFESFPFPWLRGSNVRIIIDLAANRYGADSNIPRVMYIHGMAGINFSKDLKHINDVAHHRALFLLGPLQRRAVLKAHEMYGGRLPELFEIGFLRGDRLLSQSKTFRRREFLGDLGLPDLPTILFAPTWGSFSALEEWGERVLALPRHLDINLLVRVHPLSLVGRPGEKWRAKAAQTAKNLPNIRFVESHDLDGIMLLADVMVTDISGMALEYMTLSKPVVFLPAPEYFRLYGNDRPEKWVRPARELTSEVDLIEGVRRAIAVKTVEIDIGQLVYNRGNSLNAMMKALTHICGETSSR